MTRLTLTLALFLLATTAHAEVPWTVDDGTGTGGHVPNPECTPATCDGSPFLPPEPVRPTPGTDDSSDRDPMPLTTQKHYGFCCRVDGVVRFHTAWLRDPATAHAQCDARPTKPDCDEATAAQVRNADKAAK